MAATSLVYYQDQLGKVDPQVLRLEYKITAAVTLSSIIANTASLTTCSALTQAAIDAFLGTVSEFTAAQFDATSMGADAQGVLVNMEGQCLNITQIVARCYSASNTIVTRQSQKITVLTDSSIETAVAVGANGNIGIKLNWGNTPDFDALTAGTVEIEVHWIAK